MSTYYIGAMPCSSELYHYGVKGMKWGEHLFGLAEDAARGTRAAGQYALGRATRNADLRRRGQMNMRAANAVARRNQHLEGLRTAARNTAYNVGQFLTGSEDRQNRDRFSSAAANYHEQARKALASGNRKQFETYNRMGNEMDRQAKKAQQEYESMTLPGMTEKVYREVSRAIGNAIPGDVKKTVQNLYDSARSRISGGMAKIAGGAEKAVAWLVRGWASVKSSIDKALGRYNAKPRASQSLFTAGQSNESTAATVPRRPNAAVSLNTATGNNMTPGRTKTRSITQTPKRQATMVTTRK